MIKFDSFDIGDNNIRFSDGKTDWVLRSKGYPSWYTLYQYTEDGYCKACYEASKTQPNSWWRMDYHMPTEKEAFKRRAKRLLNKIARLG